MLFGHGVADLPARIATTCRELADFPDLDTIDTAAFEKVTANNLYACSTALLYLCCWRPAGIRLNQPGFSAQVDSEHAAA
jgi:hypothetical protein